MTKQEYEEAASPRLVLPPTTLFRPRPSQPQAVRPPHGALAARAAASGSGGVRPWLVPRVKEELPDRSFPGSAGGFGVKGELQMDSSGFPVKVKSELEITREDEVLVRREEQDKKDLAMKAICQIKHTLRKQTKLTGSSGGQHLLLRSWDSDFREQLGAYIKFLLSRPDQFHVMEGGGPGLFTVENIAGTETVVAPAWGAWRKDQDKSRPAIKSEPGLRFPSGPPSVIHGSRERIAAGERLSGDIIRWCGGFGWVKPHVPIDHPGASKHNGDLFVHATDVIGAWALESGMAVDFLVYADKSGLGAEECRPMGKGGGGGKASGKGGRGKSGGASLAAMGKGHFRASSGPGRGRGSAARKEAKKEEDGDTSPPPSPRLLPAQSLRPLAPLRLASGASSSSSRSPGGAVAFASSNKEEETPSALAEEAAAEEEADDNIEAMGFIVDGEEDEDADDLGFTVDGEDADPPSTDGGASAASQPGFDVWSLLTADEDAPAQGSKPVFLKRPLELDSSGQDLKRSRP